MATETIKVAVQQHDEDFFIVSFDRFDAGIEISFGSFWVDLKIPLDCDTCPFCYIVLSMDKEEYSRRDEEGQLYVSPEDFLLENCSIMLGYEEVEEDEYSSSPRPIFCADIVQ